MCHPDRQEKREPAGSKPVSLNCLLRKPASLDAGSSQLDFFTDTELKSMIQYLSENNMTEAMAHVMEYVKNGNFKTDFSL